MRQAYRYTAALVDKWVRHLHTCRECGGPVKPTDDLCPRCGVAHPVRVPVVAAVSAVAVATLLVLLVVWMA